MQLRRDDQNDRGITLLELVIAVFVLSLGTLAALRTTDQARLAIGGASDRLFAQMVVRNRAEELQLPDGGVGLPGVVQFAGQSFTVTTETLPTAGGIVEVAIQARSAQGAGARAVVYLPNGRP